MFKCEVQCGLSLDVNLHYDRCDILRWAFIKGATVTMKAVLDCHLRAVVAYSVH
uniref:Uncharacterized protein n=1 Tax=Ascaris lumbricoides TaxID=6252 RepID=A0A0M3IJX9_ASCLU